MILEIQRTKHKGLGVFASENIRKNQKLFVLKGKLIKNKTHAFNLNCTLQIGPSSWLQPTCSYGRFINHSCNPNTLIKNKTEFVAMKNIKKGEEITIDYSTTTNESMWTMKCRCKSKNCRKIIRSFQSLPSSTFNKYKNYVQPFYRKSYLINK